MNRQVPTTLVFQERRMQMKMSMWVKSMTKPVQATL